MRKIITYLFALTVLLFSTSCKKDPVGGTAVEAMSGQWYCTIDVVDANGTVLNEDIKGSKLFYTYNTTSNSTTEMWLDDMKKTLNFKIKVNVDLNTLTFSTAPEGAENQAVASSTVTVTGGKIVFGGATNPHGTKADAFEFTVSLSNDTTPGTLYHVHGYRYTGLASDD